MGRMTDFELPNLGELEAAAALIRPVLPPTAQICWPLLCARTGTEVWVKHENHNPTGAFKVRGGMVYMAALKGRDPAIAGVIAATKGNHGQSIAHAAKRLGIAATIVAPHGNSVEKNAAMRGYGATLIEHGADFTESFEYARDLAQECNLHLVPSFDRLLVAGVGTYALELLSAVADLDTVYVPIGMGSGLCGMLAARNALNLKTKIVGAVADAAPGFALSYAARRPVSANVAPSTIADGLAVRTPDARALAVICKHAERIVSVSDDEIKSAMRHLYSDTHNIAEGAGACALAALLKDRDRVAGKRVAVVLSGGNVDRPVYRDVIAHP
jgi:threonine dehydratase